MALCGPDSRVRVVAGGFGAFLFGGKLVQQRVQEPPADDQDDLIIEDSTSPEQLAREAEMAGGTQPGAEPVVEQEAEAPAPAAPEPAEPPQAEAPPPTQEPPKPTPRVYSEEEYRRIQSAKDREVAAERRRAEEAQRRLNELNLEAQVEAYLRAEEQRLAQTMGETEARQFVRSPERTKQVRDHYAGQQRMQEFQQREQQVALEQEVQAMVVTARHFAQLYNVAPEDQGLLMTTTTPEAMEKLAKRIGVAQKKKADAAAARKATVPPETKETALESGMSSTSSPESEDTRVDRLNETPSWEWSDDDIRFMRGR